MPEDIEDLRYLFRTMNLGVVFQLADGRITSANSAAEQMLGLTLDQMQGRTSVDPRWRALREDGSDFPGEEHPAMISLRTGQEVRDVVMGVFNPVFDEYRWININAYPMFRHGENNPYKVYTSFEDITERKRMENEMSKSMQELEETTQRLEYVLGVTGASIDIIDKDFNLHYTDAILQNTYGNPEGRKCYEYYKDRDTPCDSCGVPRALETGEVVVAEQVLPKEGNRVVEVHSIPFEDEEGNWLVAEFKVDITHRKQMEEELRKSHEQFTLAVNGAQEGIWDWDLRDNSLYLSPKWKEMIGYEEHELAHSYETFESLLHPEDRPAVIDYVERYLRGEVSIFHTEFRFQHKDGSYRWILARGEALRDENGVPYRMAGSHSDITRRKEAEEKLKRFRVALDSSPDSIFIIDRESMLFVDANVTSCQQHGYEMEELLAMGPHSLKPYYSRDQLAAEFDKIIEDPQKVGTLQTYHQRKDSTYFPVEVIFNVFESYGSTMLIASVRDITKRLHVEQKLKEAKEKAEAANQAKSEFLANMSHELRTPMNVIIGMSELLSSMDLNQEQQEYADMIKDSANSLLTIINDILDFSKIEAGRLELNTSTFNLINLVENAVSPLAVRAHAKGLELIMHVEEDVPQTIKGDPNRLRQVILNLLGNAIKFTEDGEVVFTVKRDSRGQLHFAISDTGPGIPEDKQGQLFESFSQVDSSFTRKHGGTGLGLAISQKLVELMGGAIDLNSAPGKGSTFWFTVPLEQPAEDFDRDDESIAPTLAELKGMKVLVVDDNEANRWSMEDMLSRWGFVVDTAPSGQEGLEILKYAGDQGEPFDLAILDQQMPHMDGFELAEKVLREDRLPSLVLMMLSSVDLQQSTAKCGDIGVAGYMVKPIKQSELLNKIYQVLSDYQGYPSAGNEEESPIPVKDKEGMQVLLVEDKPMNQRLASVLLERKGFEVTLAQNGKHALDILDSQSFDLVLMDIQMPEMDGLEATSLIRKKEDKTGGHVPIIAMTAHAMQGDREKCLEAGMDNYVAKPINPDELYLAIEKVLSRVYKSGITKAGEPGANEMPATQFPEGSFSKSEELPSETIKEAASIVSNLGGDKDLAREMVNLLVDDARGDMEQLWSMLEKEDFDSAVLVAHGLKGQVGNLGMEMIFTLARELENSLRQKNQDAAHNNLEKFQGEIKKMEDFFARQDWKELI